MSTKQNDRYWVCSQCTLHNQLANKTCELCEAPATEPAPSPAQGADTDHDYALALELQELEQATHQANAPPLRQKGNVRLLSTDAYNAWRTDVPGDCNATEDNDDEQFFTSVDSRVVKQRIREAVQEYRPISKHDKEVSDLHNAVRLSRFDGAGDCHNYMIPDRTYNQLKDHFHKSAKRGGRPRPRGPHPVTPKDILAEGNGAQAATEAANAADEGESSGSSIASGSPPVDVSPLESMLDSGLVIVDANTSVPIEETQIIVEEGDTVVVLEQPNTPTLSAATQSSPAPKPTPTTPTSANSKQKQKHKQGAAPWPLTAPAKQASTRSRLALSKDSNDGSPLVGGEWEVFDSLLSEDVVLPSPLGAPVTVSPSLLSTCSNGVLPPPSQEIEHWRTHTQKLNNQILQLQQFAKDQVVRNDNLERKLKLANDMIRDLQAQLQQQKTAQN